MDGDLMLIEQPPEEIVLWEIDEHFDCMAAALEPAGELHHLALGASGAKVIDDQKQSHQCSGGLNRVLPAPPKIDAEQTTQRRFAPIPQLHFAEASQAAAKFAAKRRVQGADRRVTHGVRV